MNPGQIVDDRFEVTHLIGEGGLAVVYEAFDHVTGRRVALKTLKPAFANDRILRERFLREAMIASKLRSPHACVARHTGTTYFAMDLLSGATLAERLRQRGPMSTHAAARIGIDLCAALAEAHSLGIVHRDVKPDNVFLATEHDGSPSTKLIDFGLSKEPDRLDLTSEREILGTPIYMSPEQLLSPHDVDGRADIWSLGILLHEVVTGGQPFRADTAQQLVLRIVLDPPRIDRGLSPELATIIERCLAKRRDDRYASVCELASALDGVFDGSPATLRSPSFEDAGGASVVLREVAPLFVLGTCPKTVLPPYIDERARSCAKIESSDGPTITLASRSMARDASSSLRSA